MGKTIVLHHSIATKERELRTLSHCGSCQPSGNTLATAKGQQSQGQAASPCASRVTALLPEFSVEVRRMPSEQNI